MRPHPCGGGPGPLGGVNKGRHKAAATSLTPLGCPSQVQGVWRSLNRRLPRGPLVASGHSPPLAPLEPPATQCPHSPTPTSRTGPQVDLRATLPQRPRACQGSGLPTGWLSTHVLLPTWVRPSWMELLLVELNHRTTRVSPSPHLEERCRNEARPMGFPPGCLAPTLLLPHWPRRGRGARTAPSICGDETGQGRPAPEWPVEVTWGSGWRRWCPTVGTHACFNGTHGRDWPTGLALWERVSRRPAFPRPLLGITTDGQVPRKIKMEAAKGQNTWSHCLVFVTLTAQAV